MTPEEIRSKFEHGAPDRFLSFYYAVLDIVGNKLACDRYKQQRISLVAGAAWAGEQKWKENHESLTGGLDG